MGGRARKNFAQARTYTRNVFRFVREQKAAKSILMFFKWWKEKEEEEEEKFKGYSNNDHERR